MGQCPRCASEAELDPSTGLCGGCGSSSHALPPGRNRLQNALLGLMALVIIGWVARTYLRSQGDQGPPVGLKGALEAVESGDRNQAELWLRTLGTVVRTEADADEAFSALLRLLTNPSSDHRQGAANALFSVYSPIPEPGRQDTARWRKVAQARFSDAQAPLVELLNDPSLPVRIGAARTLGGLAFVANQEESLEKARVALSALMKEPAPEIRLSAAVSLSDLARLSDRSSFANEADRALIPLVSEPPVRLDALRTLRKHAKYHADATTPPPLLALADDPDPATHYEAIMAAAWYKDGPELVLPIVLKHLPNENPAFLYNYRFLGQEIRFENAALPLLIKAVESDQTAVRSFAFPALQNMGWDAQPALPTLVKLTRGLMSRPATSSSGPAPFVDLPLWTIAVLTPDSRPVPEVVEIFSDVLKSGDVSHMETASLSLGYLGKQAEAALPVLISSFETLPKSRDGVRGAIAFGLAGIVQGTPKEDEIIKILGQAWKTAEGLDKQMIGRALQRFGPRAGELVPEIKVLPPDTSERSKRPVERSPRFRYPVVR